jgi:hypothetical protein
MTRSKERGTNLCLQRLRGERLANVIVGGLSLAPVADISSIMHGPNIDPSPLTMIAG